MKNLTFLMISIGFFLIPGYSLAASHDIHIEWTYDYQSIEGRTLAGYNLYKEGVEVCTSNTPADRAIDCTIESEDGTFDFTITAFSTDGYESEHSPSYPYTLASTPETSLSTYNIHLDWTYDYQPVEGRTLAGYYLYKEGVKICTTNTPTDRSMDCSFESAEGTFDFTITAFCTDGYESPHSSPYTYTLTTVSEPILLAAFNTTPASLTGDAPFLIAFDASTSSGNIASYSWDFGDNNLSSGSQTSHTYNTPGNFNATLTLVGTSGATSQKSVVITVAPTPVAVIATTPTSLSGDIPVTVSFNGSGSTGNLSTYSWDFGDNNLASGSQTSHTYNTAGTFNATLTVISANGTVSQDSVFINVSPTPVATITTNPTTLLGDAPFAVSFDAGSSAGDITSYAWNFGDNNSGNGIQTSHTFATAGTFTTTLTVTSSNGTTSQKAVTVDVSPAPVAAITTNPTELTGDTPFTISFDASASTGNISSYAWNFGDNNLGSGSQTSHTYNTAGSFSATLTVTSSNGTTSQKSVTVVTTTPQTLLSSYNIHLDWTYDYQPVEGRTLAGYYLYKEGVKVCTTNTPTDRSMDCSFESVEGTFDFTLTAFCTDGYESPHSSPYTYTLTTVSEPILLAAFNTTPNSLSGDVPFSIAFDASTSSGNIASYSWDFGDNSSASGNQASHTYNTPGSFNATLTLIGTSGATSQKSVVITVDPAPVAVIATTPTSLSGDIPFTVSFNGSGSTGNLSTYSWNFGDNNLGSGTQTSHTYNTAGTFNATLTVISANGTVNQDSIFINVSPIPVAAITTNPTSLSGDAPFAVSFDAASSTGDIASYAWNFGDNNSGNGIQTSHTFATAGTFTTTLTVTSSNGTSRQKAVTVNVSPAPVAAITTNPTELTGDTPFTVSFDASASTGNISSYAWNFGDNSSGSGSQTNHTYATAGSFNATLTITSSNGTTSQKSVTVVTTEPPVPPVAVISPTTLSGDAPLTVSFDGSSSTSAISYAWSFGDGATASTNQTNHTFTIAGTYTTTLTVTNAEGLTNAQSVTVTANEAIVENTPPTAVIGSSAAVGDAPLNVNFDGSASHDNEGAINSYLWNFGDGSQTTTGSSVTHNYTIPGTYSASLTVTDSEGAQNTTSTPVIITGQAVENQPPTARITASTIEGTIPLEVTFDGSTSTDPENSVLTYNWNFGDGASGQGSTVTHIYTSPGSFIATLTITDEVSATASSTTTITAAGAPDFQIELGEVEIDQNWMRVDFTDPFINPVVVAGPPSYNGGNPCTVRLREIDSTGFDIRIQEWDYLDGTHSKETVAYLVMEQGNFTLDDGTMIEAGQFTSNDTSFQEVQFNTFFSVDPVVMTSIATFNEEDAVTSRLRNISTTAFEHKTQEQELGNEHGNETISYIAWEPSQSSIDNINVIVNKTADKVKSRWYIIDYDEQLPDVPIFLGTMQSQDGIDTSTIRYTNKTNTEIDVKVEEEQSQDDETRHTSETVGYFLFSSNSNP